MTEERLRSFSPSLVGFLEPLAARDRETFGDFATLFPAGAPDVDEQLVRYRLADHAVRVCAAEVLDLEKCTSASATLRALPTIIDGATAAAAADAVREVGGLESAALAAENAPTQVANVNEPGFVGEQVAYAVLALADFYVELSERKAVLDDAVRLAKSLCS